MLATLISPCSVLPRLAALTMSQPTPAPRKSAADMMAEWQSPDSVMSRYVHAQPISAQERVRQEAEAALRRATLAASTHSVSAIPMLPPQPPVTPAQSPRRKSAGSKSKRSSLRSAPSIVLPQTPSTPGAAPLVSPSPMPSAPVPAGAAAFPFDASSVYAPAPFSASSTPSASSRFPASPLASTSGRYHTPLQRNLLSLNPCYTESELAIRTRFAPTFYTGPACVSLKEDERERERDQEAIKQLAVVAAAQSHSGVGGGVLALLPPSARRAEALEKRRQAALQNGELAHTPGAQAFDPPLSPGGVFVSGSSSGSGSGSGSGAGAGASASSGYVHSPHSAVLPALTEEQAALLSSSFQAVDDAYPSPMSSPHARSWSRGSFDTGDRD